jgi:hypothetical protein
VELPGGGMAIVCGSSPARRCVRCRKPATIQCDFPLPGGKTCDTYLCRVCAVPMGRGRDYCPEHVPPAAA